MATKRLKLKELKAKSIEFEAKEDYIMALRYAKRMIYLDNMYMDGYHQKALAYFGLQRYQDCIAVCDGKDQDGRVSTTVADNSNNNNTERRTSTTVFTSHSQLARLRQTALSHLLDQGGFKIDFIGSIDSALPQELIDMTFNSIDFTSFVTCTRVSPTWCNVLTNQVWASVIVPRLQVDPFSHLTEDEMGLLVASLRGEEKFHLVTSTKDGEIEHTRVQVLATMGDCNLYSLDIGGFSDSLPDILQSNMHTLSEITVSSAVLTLTVSLILRALVDSQVTTLTFSGPYEVVDDLELNTNQVLYSLLHVWILDFHTQHYCDRNRIPSFMISTIRFFLQNCPNLQSLVIHPAENKRVFSRRVLREIENLRPDSLGTVEFYTEG